MHSNYSQRKKINKKSKINAGLYIHIPFCKVKCVYCDFYTVTKKEDKIPLFTQSIIDEIEQYKYYSKKWVFNTLFFGGGTPSSLPAKYLEKILKKLHDTFDISDLKEITLEANPGEASLEYLRDIKSLGINRISMGFQSFNDKTLKILGRLHNSKDCFKTFKNVRKAGFENINADMIFNIPNLTVNNWKKDLNKLLELNPEHISAYSLTVEPSTKLFNLVKRKEIIMPLEDTDIEQFLVTEDILLKNGYNHYEISNYSKSKKECLHNLHYWNLSPYLSFGPSAHSYDLKKRWWNVRSLEKYINKISSSVLPLEGSEEIEAKDHYNEMILNSLRLSEGLDLNLLKRSYLGNFDDYISQIINKWDCMEINDQSLRLSRNGMLFVDEISSDMFI